MKILLHPSLITIALELILDKTGDVVVLFQSAI